MKLTPNPRDKQGERGTRAWCGRAAAAVGGGMGMRAAAPLLAAALLLGGPAAQAQTAKPTQAQTAQAQTAQSGRHPELGTADGSMVEPAPLPGAAAAPLPGPFAGPLPLLPTGPIPGGAVLPNGRTVQPAGTAATVGVLPLGMALSPDGRWLAVLNDGRFAESISVIDTTTGAVASTTPVEMAFLGTVFSHDGGTLWVAGGGSNSLLRFRLDPASGKLQPLAPVGVAGYPTGLAISEAGQRLYCTQNYGNQLSVLDAATGQELSAPATGHMPYGVAAGPGGAWVTTWADGTLQHISDTGARTPPVSVGKLAGPVASSPGGRYVFACASNEDRLLVLDTTGATSTQPGKVIGAVSFAPYPGAPPGSLPTALAVDPVSSRIFVALSGLNAVAVVDPAAMSVVGLIPTGWYPSALAVSPDGSRLYVAAAKGLGTGPNSVNHQSIAALTVGQVYTVPLTGTGSLETNRPAWWSTVLRCNGMQTGSNRPGPTLPPIKHVIYVVKENRTYDQVLGDLGRGNGDPTVAVYGRAVTPNTHALAERFAIGDNFYSDGEVSVQGHQWTLGANCPDYVERTWPQVYAGHARIDDSTETPVTYPANGYLMHACLLRGISSRMYGDRVMRDNNGKELPGLAERVCRSFRGWDTKYPDTQREAAWEKEFQAGIFPAYSYIWLPDDHTAGTKLGFRTPRAMVATNDLALARLVSAISHSPHWKDTVIFVTEDDSQDGLDHVDAHRNLLLVISPWVRPGAITSTHLSQVSISHTIDMLLGLPPLSQFDANAPLIADIWGPQPDTRPFETVPETVDITQQNTVASAMHRESERLDLSEPDTSTDGLLERILLADAGLRAKRGDD